MKNLGKLSIIITTKDNYQLTRFCIDTICATLPKDVYEIIIVDNGSTDQTLALEKEFKFVKNDRGGLYTSWNMGIEASNNDYIFTLNNDVYFCSKDWWKWLYLGLTETNARWVWPTMIEKPESDPELYYQISELEKKETLKYKPMHGVFNGASFAVHKSIYDEVGFFDESFDIWYGEKDFEIRLIKKGLEYGEIQNFIIRHFQSCSIGEENAGSEQAAEALMRRKKNDYEIFKNKYQDEDLERYGFSIKPFGISQLIV